MITQRFPLYAKILLRFGINLMVLAALLFILIRAQFGIRLDWTFLSNANDRMEAVTELILGDLAGLASARWNSVLDRFGAAYQVQFYLFRNDGNQMAGEVIQLPAAVRQHIVEARPQLLRRRAPLLSERGIINQKEWEGRPDELDRSRWRREPMRERRPGSPGLAPGPEHRPNPKFMVRTTEPTRYWLLVRTGMTGTETPLPIPVTLVAMSDSLSGGGLFFDFKPWIVLGLGAVAISALIWLPFIYGMTRSVGQLTQATRHIAQGRFDVKVDESRNDELGLLGQSINQMASRLEGLVGGQKRFLSDVAHELCSPLARLRVALGIIEQRANEAQRSYVNTANEKAEQMAELVNELLSFSKAALGSSTLKCQPVSLREIAEKAMARETVEGITVHLEVEGDLVVMAEPELLLRSVSNLLRNAIRYAGQAGPITISAKSEGRDGIMVVSDCGPGVPPGELTRIFDPFYRLDPSRDRSTGGVGLGLSIVKTCVESCQGTVTCSNRQPSGLEVVLRLPMAP